VLTERNEHLDDLAGRLAPLVRNLVVLRGGTGLKAARGIAARLASIPEDEERVLLATGRYIGEGFDDARLDTLFLTLPVSWRGTIAQYAGRLHRLNDRKREVRVYDYADLNVPMLARMFDRRCRGYEAVGYTILLPASAVPGWPAEVPLPLEPQWKSDYAASVRRLVRDGVDAPLAGLFVHVAREPAPDAEGAGRARSATEAFLYRRLETLVRCQEPFLSFFGRPCGRSVLSSPKRRTIWSDQRASPKGQPRSTDRRSAANSASVCGALTSCTQFAKRRRGQAAKSSLPLLSRQRWRLPQRQSSARSTRLARRALRST